MAMIGHMRTGKKSAIQRTKDVERICPNGHIVMAKRMLRKLQCPHCKIKFGTMQSEALFI